MNGTQQPLSDGRGSDRGADDGMSTKTLIDYQGRRVRLTAERQRHILEHPEMAGLDSAIEQTLRDPQLVIQSRTDAAAALHYLFCTGTVTSIFVCNYPDSGSVPQATCLASRNSRHTRAAYFRFQ